MSQHNIPSSNFKINDTQAWKDQASALSCLIYLNPKIVGFHNLHEKLESKKWHLSEHDQSSSCGNALFLALLSLPVQGTANNKPERLSETDQHFFSLLESLGCDPIAPVQYSDFTADCLDLAVLHNAVGLVEAWSSYVANWSERRINGQPWLCFCIKQNYSEMAGYLLSQKDVINHVDGDGNSAIFYAKDNKLVELLLQHGADLNARNNNGQTPIEYWISQANEDLSNVFDMVEELPQSKKSECFHYLSVKSSASTLNRYYKEWGIKPNQQIEGETLLEVALDRYVKLSVQNNHAGKPAKEAKKWLENLLGKKDVIDHATAEILARICAICWDGNFSTTLKAEHKLVSVVGQEQANDLLFKAFSNHITPDKISGKVKTIDHRAILKKMMSMEKEVIHADDFFRCAMSIGFEPEEDLLKRLNDILSDAQPGSALFGNKSYTWTFMCKNLPKRFGAGVSTEIDNKKAWEALGPILENKISQGATWPSNLSALAFNKFQDENSFFANELRERIAQLDSCWINHNTAQVQAATKKTATRL